MMTDRAHRIEEAVAPPPMHSKGEQAYRALKEAILSGTIPPGAPIDKGALCHALRVSRFPVAAAINRLALERLVVIAPQHGSFAAPLALHEAEECMMIRGALEGEVATLAAERRPLGLAEALEANLAAQAAAAATRNASGFYELDVAFHAILCDALGLGQSATILDGLRSRLERLRRLLAAPLGRNEASLAEHRRIAEAVLRGDPEAARAAMRAHLAETTALFRRFARANATLFTDGPTHA